MNNAYLQKSINDEVGVTEAPIDGKTYGRKDASWTEVISGIPEAPVDGTYYGRQDNSWKNVTEEAPDDGNLYSRKNKSWTIVTSFPEAPNDGTIYGRQNLAWTNVPSEAPADGNIYGRKNNTWVLIGGGIPDAPADNNTYSRQNNSWVAASAYGVGGIETKIAGLASPINNNIFTWVVAQNTEPVSLEVDLLAYTNGNLDQGGRFILEGSFWRGAGNIRSSSTQRSMENIAGSQNLRLVSSGTDTVLLQLRTITSTVVYRAIIKFNPWGAFI